MGRAIPVPITPAVLSWAISESGYSPVQLAERLHVPLETLQAWQERRALPTLTQFKRLATILRRPSATFLLPEPPPHIRPQVQFRHPPKGPREALNPTELRYLRDASRLQRALAWLLPQLGWPPGEIPKVEIGFPAEQVAAATRQRLGVDVQRQQRWTSAAEALREWRASLQDAGVLVFLLPLGRQSCTGFSLWDDQAPLIAVNTWWNTQARIFTLFHEYGHLLTRTNSACVDGRRGPHGGDLAERWCDQFAGSVLLPWDAVAEYLRGILGWSPGKVITDLKVAGRIAREFKVSLRAATLTLISHQAATWDLYEEIPPVSDEKIGGGGGEGGRERHQIRRDAYGDHTISLFLAAVDQDLLGRTEASGYLDIADSDLDILQREVAGSEG